MDIKAGDQVVDLLGDLGIGKVINVYVNFNDDPTGIVTAVCEFPGGDPDGRPTVCDRLLDQISADLSLATEPPGMAV